MMTKFLINHRNEDDDESLGSFYLEHNFFKVLYLISHLIKIKKEMVLHSTPQNWTWFFFWHFKGE